MRTFIGYEACLENILQCLPSEIHHLLQAFPDAIVSGGFVRDAIVGHPYNDIDIYATKEVCAEMFAWWQKNNPGQPAGIYPSKYEVQVDVFGPNTDGTFLVNTIKAVQLIHGFTISNFDLRCCKSTYSIEHGLYISAQAANGVMGLAHPTAGTFGRMLKLKDRGWYADISEYHTAAIAWKPECDSISHNS